MKIRTDIPIELSNGNKTDKEINVYEAAFSTLSIHSDIGSAIITTEYSKRHIKCFGNLIVTELYMSLDENGLPVINVTRGY
jgi:hypothetical protein